MNLQSSPSVEIGSTEVAEPDRIDKVEAMIVDVPFRRLQRFARFESRAQSSLVIRLWSKDGAQGVGEAVAPCGPWWSGDSVEAMHATFVHYIKPLLIGAKADAPGPTMHAIGRSVRGNSFVKAGVEMALLDLQGRKLGVPIATLLGGTYRTNCAVAWPIASGDIQQDCAEMDNMLETRRASAFKVKMGALPLSEDMARIDAYMSHLNGRAGLRVDPNEAWSEAEALPAMVALEATGIDFVEQPLPRHQMASMARLAAKTTLPLMIDEGACSAADTLCAAEHGAAQILSLKLMKAGGILPSLRMANLAAITGMSPYMGTFLETSLGTAAALHLACALPSLPFGGEIIGPMLMSEDLVETPIRYVDGAAQLPSGPGLGVDLDESRLCRFQRQS
ncbi:muconate/chloromuconate family cycloisomerase [Roseobacter weihaiensis]|uniref:muconate/chloromuconate family cycloisomerase n=1 Tax=Roseobacter weihaiensis TaxID=2763262 RepID=UPI001D0B8213|nr:muconate/chloromuconate family cycloisomerase [Roseobacter sp. H9]